MELHPKEVGAYWKTRCNFKINDEKIKRIIYAYKNGATKRHAAAYAGISLNTLKNWLALGEEQATIIEAGNKPTKKNIPYLDLWARVCAIEVEIQIEAFNYLREAASIPDNWRAAVEILKMRFGSEYNPMGKNELDITNIVEKPFTITMRSCSEE